jgi:hypothetical protein
MRLTLKHLTPLLGAGAVAVAIAAAPIAAAAPDTAPTPNTGQQCTGSGPGTVCRSPGNVQINDAPSPVSFYPYGGEAFLL